MEKEKAFAAALHDLVKLARSQGNVVSEDQIKEFFNDILLDNGQLDLIKEYLKQNKIGINHLVDPEEYLTEEDVHYLDIYLLELKLLEQCTKEQREDIMKLAMKGNVQAQEKLIVAYLPEVVEISKLYAGQGVLVEDLIGEGNVALTLGVKMLECAEDVKEAEGILIKIVMDAMEKHINEYQESDDEDKKMVGKINKIADLSKEMAENIGRKITIEEFVQESDYTVQEVLEAIKITAHGMEYIEDEENAMES